MAGLDSTLSARTAGSEHRFIMQDTKVELKDLEGRVAEMFQMYSQQA